MKQTYLNLFTIARKSSWFNFLKLSSTSSICLWSLIREMLVFFSLTKSMVLSFKVNWFILNSTVQEIGSFRQTFCSNSSTRILNRLSSYTSSSRWFVTKSSILMIIWVGMCSSAITESLNRRTFAVMNWATINILNLSIWRDGNRKITRRISF